MGPEPNETSLWLNYLLNYRLILIPRATREKRREKKGVTDSWLFQNTYWIHHPLEPEPFSPRTSHATAVLRKSYWAFREAPMPPHSKGEGEPGCPARTPQVLPPPDTGHLQTPRALRPQLGATTSTGHPTRPKRRVSPLSPHRFSPSLPRVGSQPRSLGAATAPHRSVRGLAANNARLFWRN